MHGARISLAVSCLAILVGGILGTGLGMLAAFRGGFLDALVMRIVDIKLAFPSILLALTLVVAIGSRVQHRYHRHCAAALGPLCPRSARRSFGHRERDFIDRARVAGASTCGLWAVTFSQRVQHRDCAGNAGGGARYHP